MPDTSNDLTAGYEAVLPRRTPGTVHDRLAETRVHVAPPSPEDLPYELVDRPEPPPVPNGWYALASSSDLAPGDVVSVIAVQREFAVFRGADGEVHVLDAHCPHMGAHLGGGDVVGDTLACPYHGWQFAGTGACVEIPYSDARIPSRACVRSYPVREVAGMVLFWYHAGGAEPDYEVPGVDEIDDPAFTDAFVHRGELVASLQDMAENNVDYTHFYFVHRREALNESTSKFTTDGPFSTVVERFDDGKLVFTRYTYGPGIALLRVTDLMTVLTATTPIDRRHVRLLWHFYLPHNLADAADAIIEGVTGEFGLGADRPIWRDKVFRERPLLVKGDGPIAEFRRWYAQFYEGAQPSQ
ncbi:MAG: Rieske 2Fe-2S domain-containing protein [Acidimicrobiales bacterium]